MRVTYFGSDLTDPATARRIHVLRVGGANVNIIGYRRVPEPVREIEGFPVVDLGQTFDTKLAPRVMRILQDSCKVKLLQEAVRQSDVLLGRNLEMATMAAWAKSWAPSHARLAYECLDIHRRFLGNNPVAGILRECERFILRRASSLIISSPGFVTHYFRKLGICLPQVVLAENKRVMVNADMRRPHNGRTGSPPWCIGWFGKLRCVESFHILYNLARHYPDLVEVRLYGQPLPEVRALIDRNLPLPNMRFGGPYKSDDLESMYAACDFTWTIEYYNLGSNSDWCLANRIYEGGFNNCPTIARAGTETAAWLTARNVGIILREPMVDLESFLLNLTADHYRTLREACEKVPINDLVWTGEECQEFLARISDRMHA